jgi:hypothetical protein
MKIEHRESRRYRRLSGALRLAAPVAAFAATICASALVANAQDAQPASADVIYQLRGSSAVVPAQTAPAGTELDTLDTLDEIDAGNAPPVVVPSIEEEAQGRALPEQPLQPLADSVDAPDETLANPAVGPIEDGVARPPEVNPFLPVGFRAGTWNVFARIDQALGYSTNTGRTPDGEAGAILTTNGKVSMRSDWSRHEATIDAQGGIEQGLNSEDETIPEANVAGKLRLDIVDGYAVNLRANYDFNTEDSGSDDSGRFDVQEYGGSAELLRGGRKLELSVKASADRTVYGDAPLENGGRLDQQDRNNTLFQLTGRAGYEMSPAMKPFVQAGIGRRLHDNSVDSNGVEVDGTLYDLRTGVAVDLGEKIRGEAAIGYLTEDYDGDTLATVSTPSLNANLVWSPVRGTDITFTAATELDSASAAGQSGSVTQSLGAASRTQVNDRLAVLGEASVQTDTYEDGTNDATWSIGAGLEYALSRYLAVTANVEQETFDAATKGSSWNASTVTVGMALQR